MNTTKLQTTFTPTTLQIPAKLLLCIREFAARSDIRYYLNTLHFSTRAGRAYISATDGHMGGIIRSDEGAVPQYCVTSMSASSTVPVALLSPAPGCVPAPCTVTSRGCVGRAATPARRAAPTTSSAVRVGLPDREYS